ncbi:Lsr2 family DNA-binding protein [Streptomyces phaeoluteigriseus]
MVADIPEVAAQWHPDNPARPEDVRATAQKRGEQSPYKWQCPLELGHDPWAAWPKDRIKSGAGCPACRKLIRLVDIPTLAAQYRGPVPAREVNFAAHERMAWVCRMWAVDPETGGWYRVEHHFDAVIKERALQGDGCRVCAGYVIDDTNSLHTWFPEIADELDDPDIDARTLPTSRHNVSRKEASGEKTGGVYATLWWRCRKRKHHRWEATILNRVLGNGCRWCSRSGISKEQVRLVAELAGLMDLVPPQQRDAWLPDGTPDFTSHQVTIPTRHKPEHWRYKAMEVDAVFHLPSHGIRIGVEYDGAFHHSAKLRDRRRSELEKSRVLATAGILDLLVHVRVGDLPPLEAPHAVAVAVPERATPYEQACAVAAAVNARFPGSVPGLDAYMAGGLPHRQAEADVYIRATWGELRPPRRRMERPAPARPRRLMATEPHPESLLTPVGEPYRNPERPAEIVRDYRCMCGSSELFTAVQAQVTSGNTRSCGCLSRQAKRQKRPAVSRAETQAIRAWARDQGLRIATSGRVPDRVTASYRLHRAGCLDLLDRQGLLDEASVRRWAEDAGQRLGARGRVTGPLWLDYAADYLTRAAAGCRDVAL